jgi:methylmalonyl-CoA mutase, N-terminal domain
VNPAKLKLAATFGATDVVNAAETDPVKAVAELSDGGVEIEAEAEQIFAHIRRMGGGDGAEHAIGPMTSGILAGIENGYFSSEIAESAFQYQQALEKGDKKIVGVNCHTNTVTKELEIMRISHEVEIEQKRELAGRRAGRDQATVDAALARMVEVARTEENLIPAMLAAARAEATLGEICGVLRDEWGSYREPARF